MQKSERLAKVISALLQPTFVAAFLYGVVSFSFLQPPSKALFYWLVGFLFATLLPTLLVIKLAQKGRVSDPDLPHHRERFIPYLLITALYAAGFLVLYLLKAPHPLLGITACYIGVTAVGAFISLFWKISMHLAGVAGPVTALVYYLNPSWALLYALLFLLGWARLYLKKHNLYQILAGSAFSALMTYGILHLWFQK
ncbi:hypothetical protein [Atrimonas thermophila]|uniref:hypothetical protein n=1 Tax=Atrimonas thermophila TaxID=3064161 RepID=UPI00399CE848